MHPYGKQAKTGQQRAEKYADGGRLSKRQWRYGGAEDLSDPVSTSQDTGANAVGFYAKRRDVPPPSDATGVSVSKGVQDPEKPNYIKD